MKIILRILLYAGLSCFVIEGFREESVRGLVVLGVMLVITAIIEGVIKYGDHR